MAVRLVSPGQQIATPVRGQADINTRVLDTSAIGAGLEAGANTINQALARRDAQRAQVDILDAEHQLAQAENEMLYAPETGALNKTGQNAFDVAKTTIEAYAKKAEELGKRFTTPEAKQVWKQRTLQRQDDIERNLLRHEAGERTKYADATTTNYIAESQNTAALNYNNPERVQGEIIRQQEAIMVRAQQTGLPAEQVKVLIDTARSNTQMSVISRKMTADPFEAQAYYDKVRSQLTAEDAAKTEQALKPYVEDAQEASLAAQFIGGMPVPILKGPSTPLVDAVIGQESGGNPNARSSAGAVGLMQLLPDTAKEVAKDLGIPWDPAKMTDPEYNRTLGTAYLNKQLARFDGNVPAALAAYNMGPGAAEGWFAGKPYTTQSGAKWYPKGPMDYDAMPAETREYVKRITTKMGGAPGEAGNQPGSEADALARASQLPANLRSGTIAKIRLKFDIEKIDEANTNQAFSESVFTKIENSPVGTDLTKLVTPEEMAWLNASGKRAAFDTRVQDRIKGQNPYELGEAGSIAAMFYYAANGDKKSMDKVRLFNPYDPNLKIPLNMRQAYANDKSDLMGGMPTKRTATIKSIGDMTERMAYSSLGLPPADSRTPAQKKEFDKFNGALAQSAAAWKNSHDGKDPTEAEMQRLADYLVIDTAKGRLFEQKGNVSIDIIPPATLAQLKKDFAAEGIPFSPALAIRYYLQAGGGQ